MVRDGRAVVNSYLKVDFWEGWRGPQNWRWGPISPKWQAEWEDSNRSFVVLAALQWKILLDAVENDLDWGQCLVSIECLLESCVGLPQWIAEIYLIVKVLGGCSATYRKRQ